VKRLALSEEQMRIHAEENQALQKIDAEKSALRSRRSALAAEARSNAAEAAKSQVAADAAPAQLLGGR
jgi:hypothetical protein